RAPIRPLRLQHSPQRRGDSFSAYNSWLPPSSRARGSVDRRAHLLIGAAAADVADVGVDVGIARPRLLLKQRSHRHDHAALAIAALRHVVLEPSLLHLVQRAVLGKTLDRVDLLS